MIQCQCANLSAIVHDSNITTNYMVVQPGLLCAIHYKSVFNRAQKETKHWQIVSSHFGALGLPGDCTSRFCTTLHFHARGSFLRAVHASARTAALHRVASIQIHCYICIHWYTHAPVDHCSLQHHLQAHHQSLKTPPILSSSGQQNVH